MSRARIGQVKLTGTTGAKALISQLSITGSARGRARVRELKLTGSVNTAKARLRELKLFGSIGPIRAAVSQLKLTGITLTALTANAGGGQNVEAYTTFILNGTASTGVPTGYSWAQISNGAPAVTIVGSGAVVAAIAPPTVAGCDLVFELTVTRDASSATDRSTVSVYPHMFWYLAEDSTTWTPYKDTTLG